MSGSSAVESMSTNEPLFTERYSKEIWGSAYRSVDELETRIFELGLIIWPPSPWSDERFLKNPAEMHKRGFHVSSDLVYPAIWEAQAQVARSKISDKDRVQLLVLIGKVINECTVAVATLNAGLLSRTAECLLNIAEARNISLQDSLERVINSKDRWRILSPHLVKNIEWPDIFAWQIPALDPTQKPKSLAIGRCFWTLFNVESITKDEDQGIPNECMWDIRTRMIALAEVLEF